MIKNGFFFLFSVFLSSAALAQTSSMPMPRETTSGFRISIVKPSLTGTLNASFLGGDSNFSVPDTNGFSIGYASLAPRSFGWLTNATIFEMRDQTSANFLRLDGSLAYMVNGTIYLKGGINSIHPVNSPAFTPELGGQVGVGFQMTKNFGLDVSYTNMNARLKVTIEEMSGDIYTYNVKYRFAGPEIGLTGTF